MWSAYPMPWLRVCAITAMILHLTMLTQREMHSSVRRKGVCALECHSRFSMHAELLYYWLSALGLPAPQSVDIRTVPPPLMADAIESGEIDAFCVGEPWGSQAVENGRGRTFCCRDRRFGRLRLKKCWRCAPIGAEQESALMGAVDPGCLARWALARGTPEPDVGR